MRISLKVIKFNVNRLYHYILNNCANNNCKKIFHGHHMHLNKQLPHKSFQWLLMHKPQFRVFIRGISVLAIGPFLDQVFSLSVNLRSLWILALPFYYAWFSHIFSFCGFCLAYLSVTMQSHLYVYQYST